MKVRADQIEALRQEELARARSKPETGKFGDMLAQEVQKTTGPEGAASMAPGAKAQGVNPLLQVEEVAAAETQTPSEREVMENIDSLLNKWENYAHVLKAPAQEEGLRQAYGVLENIHSGVSELKESAPNLGQDHPNLKSVVDELEIMTVTERFKFNRGDYL